MATKNNNLHNAKRQKNDEFYTTRAAVELELNHYKEHFRGKVVYCNCDDPIESEFTWYFARKFEDWGLKRLISTGYKESGHGVMYVYEGDKNGNLVPDRSEWKITELQGNGDFRSEECVEYLKQADIVVSNPPFSLFREFVAQLIEYGKEFLIIGNKNAITYKEIFPLIKENKLWLGISSPNEFILPNGEITKTVSGLCRWFTNLTHSKRNRPLDLVQKFDERYYNVYDNYPAVNIDKVMDIPCDEDITLTLSKEVYPKWKNVYGEDCSIVEDNEDSVKVKIHNSIYGVPISFLDKYCPNQFRIVDARNIALNDKQKNKSTMLIKDADSAINGKATYARICIQKI